MDPIAYTYEADIHCPDCAVKRFGRDDRGLPVPAGVQDREGNEPGAVFSWTERGGDGTQGESCGTCGAVIREPLEDDDDEIDEAAIEAELVQKAVVVRDGARGWRLGQVFVSDALDLLEEAGVKVDRDAFEIPDEDDVDYSQTMADYERELEDALDAAGFTSFWNDGYVIYKDLSEKALEYTAEGMG